MKRQLASEIGSGFLQGYLASVSFADAMVDARSIGTGRQYCHCPLVGGTIKPEGNAAETDWDKTDSRKQG